MTGTEDARPARDVAEALTWFRDDPRRLRCLDSATALAIDLQHAATIVRAALAAEPDDVVHDAVWSLEMLVARYQDREESAVIDPMQGKAFGVVASQLAPVVERLSTALAGARPAAGPDTGTYVRRDDLDVLWITCDRCGALVGDTFRHSAWHEEQS